MKFTKYNNPNRKRTHKKLDYTERMIAATKEMLIDKHVGYNISAEYYENKHDLKKAGENNADSD